MTVERVLTAAAIVVVTALLCTLVVLLADVFAIAACVVLCGCAVRAVVAEVTR